MSIARPFQGTLSVERDNIMTLLRMRRECFGLSQAALGGQIGIPKQMLSEYERGTVTPNLATLMRWANALDCRIEVTAK